VSARGDRRRGQPATAHHRDLPAAVGPRAGGDELVERAQRGEALPSVDRADDRAHPVALTRGLLVSAGLGEALDPGDQLRDDVGRIPGHRCREAADVHGVLGGALRSVAGRAAAADLGERARRTVGRQRDPDGALPQRHGVVERRHHRLGAPAVGERAQGDVAVGAADRQPGEALAGQSQPQLAARPARPAVVARLELADRPQLAHLRLEQSGARNRVDALGDDDHLGHPAPGLGRGEVGPHAGADVRRLADVERASLAVAEDVHAGAVGQVLGEVPLAAHLLRHLVGERDQLLERPHAEVADPLDQAVQHVDGRTGVLERAVVRRGRRPEDAGERRQLAVRCLVTGERAAREQGGVDDREPGPRLAEPFGAGLEEADVERRVVRDEHAAAGELEERRQHRRDRRRARHHHVGDAGEHGDERRDRAVRAHQRLELAEHLAGLHLHRADLGDLAVGRRAAGGLEVDDDERDLAERGPELVEGGLHRQRSRHSRGR